MDIDKMEAGAELNVLVAEKAMEWEVLEVGYTGTEEESARQRELRDWMDRVEITAIGTYAIDVERDWWMELDTGFGKWSPSTDIADALWVLETRFPWPRYYTRLQRTSSGKWRCDIELNGGDGPTISAAHEEAPLAISRATLRATEAEGNGE